MSEASFTLSHRDRKRLAALLRTDTRPLAVRTTDGDIELPFAARRAIAQLLADLAAGSVHILSEDRDLTTQEAAGVLGLSRTFVVRLIDSGKLPAHMAGTHRRVRSADALAYLKDRERRLTAIAALAHEDALFGLPYR